MASGRTTMRKMFHSEQPSILAASDSSSGMVRKNWRRRKILNALPNQAGTQSGRNDPIQCSFWKSANVGTIKTGNGTIIVASVAAKAKSRPGKRRRAKP